MIKFYDEIENAKKILYDNSTSGLSATDVQSAIDVLKSLLDSLSALDISYDNTSSGLSATNVQSAIDELKVLFDSGGGGEVIAENYESYTGTANSTNGVTVSFSSNTAYVDITIYDNDAKVSLSTDGNNFGGDIIIKAGETYSINYSAKAVKILCNVSGKTSGYRVSGWW